MTPLQIRAVKAIPHFDGGKVWQAWTSFTRLMPGAERLRARTMGGGSWLTRTSTVRSSTPQGEIVHGTPNGAIRVGDDARAWKVVGVSTLKGQRVIKLDPVRHGVVAGHGVLPVVRGMIGLGQHLRGFDASNDARMIRGLDGTRTITVNGIREFGESSTPRSHSISRNRANWAHRK